MGFNLERDTEILQRTPSVLRSLLSGLGDAWLMSNSGSDTWSPTEIASHYLHNELNDWIPRLRWILDRGEAEPFPPYDPKGNRDLADLALAEVLDRFETARRASLDELRTRLTPGVLSRRGTHPALGLVTLDQMLCAWVVHDLHHIAQIARTLACQRADDVGPWVEYLSILRRR
ncbi:MAG: DinB family protein [Planctomycetota bacterium]